MIGAWSIGAQWESGPGALTPAAISCVLYSIVATPFKSLSLLMRTLVLLSLFSFVVKFGLMVQITDLWQFLLFLFPLFVTMQLLKLQMPKLAGLWGQLIVFMGSFIAVTNPPVYDFADFLNDNTAKIVGVAISAGVCDFAPRFRCRKAAAISARYAGISSISLAVTLPITKASLNR